MIALKDVSRRYAIQKLLAGSAAAAAVACSRRDLSENAADNGFCKPMRRRKGSLAVNETIRNLVIANRILAHEEVVDAYGHVSARHPEIPEHFFISRSLSPELVTPDDIMEVHQNGAVLGDDKRHPYLERFIHGSIYGARPEFNAICHAHAPEVLPFTVGSLAMRPVVHSAGAIGETVPVWDMKDRFGDTDLLVTNEQQGNDLADRLDNNNVVLMRGHGFAAAGRSIIEMVTISLSLKLNARVLLDALPQGEVTYLSAGEIAKTKEWDIQSSAVQRGWRYWAKRAGCSALLDAAQ